MGVLRDGYDRAGVVATISDNYRSGRVSSKAARRVVSDDDADASNVAAPPAAASSVEDFQLPATLAFVSRAMSQMQGVGLGLDPDFEFVAATAPFLPEVKGTQRYLEDSLRKALPRGLSDFVGSFANADGEAGAARSIE